MEANKILHLDINGQPIGWITWQDAVCYHAKQMVVWELGQTEIDVHGGESRLTGKRSIITTSSIIAVRGATKRNYAARIAVSNSQMFIRDRNICAYCANQFKSSELSRDHVIPKSRGGKDDWQNVVTACLSCNHKKADRTPAEAGMQLVYVPYAPNRIENLILENRNILADQMEFLLSFISENSPLRSRLSQH